MKYASIDIGTNSVRLLMAEYDGITFRDVQKHVTVTRLGRGVADTGVLSEKSMRDTVDAVDIFAQMSRSYGAKGIYVMATSAARDAQNAADFLERLKMRTGIQAEIITGLTEAQIGFQGVLLGMPDSKTAITPQLVIDIGGGSTELIVGTKEKILFSHSLNIGAVRMTGTYVSSDPISETDYTAIQNAVSIAVKSIAPEIQKYTFTHGIGIGGTAATFATIYKKMPVYDRDGVHGAQIPFEEVCAINQMLKAYDVESRKQIIGLEPKRADVILAGGIILETVLESFGCPFLEVSDSDNLEGFMAYCVAREKSS